MSIAVFFSRILGLIRDQVMAAFFGTSLVSDAFNVAFRIPNLLRGLFGEGALSAAFVPIYNEFGIKRGKKYQFLFALNMLSILSFFLMVLTLLGVIFAPLIVKIIYPGLGPEVSELAIKLCRVMYPYLFLVGLSSTFIAILNSHNIFFITGLSSGLWNIGWILMLLFGFYIFKVKELNNLVYFAAYGVVIGGFLQTIVNLPYLRAIGYRFKVILRFRTKAMKSLWNRFLPGIFGMGVREINLIAEGVLASFLPLGSITALGYGYRLMQLPLGMFGISISTAILPEYSRQFTERKWTELSETFKYSICFILFVLAPISVIMIMGAEVFVRLIFERGSFGESSVYMTKLALIFYSVGLCFYGLNHIITPLFFAAKDTKTPVKIAGIMLFVNILLSIVLMRYMALAGIALSSSICALVQFGIKYKIIMRKLPDLILSNMRVNILKLGMIIGLLVGVLFLFNQFYVYEPSFLNNLLKSLALLGVSFVVLLTSFHVLKPEYYREIYSKIKGKRK